MHKIPVNRNIIEEFVRNHLSNASKYEINNINKDDETYYTVSCSIPDQGNYLFIMPNEFYENEYDEIMEPQNNMYVCNTWKDNQGDKIVRVVDLKAENPKYIVCIPSISDANISFIEGEEKEIQILEDFVYERKEESVINMWRENNKFVSTTFYTAPINDRGIVNDYNGFELRYCLPDKAKCDEHENIIDSIKVTGLSDISPEKWKETLDSEYNKLVGRWKELSDELEKVCEMHKNGEMYFGPIRVESMNVSSNKELVFESRFTGRENIELKPGMLNRMEKILKENEELYINFRAKVINEANDRGYDWQSDDQFNEKVGRFLNCESSNWKDINKYKNNMFKHLKQSTVPFSKKLSNCLLKDKNVVALDKDFNIVGTKGDIVDYNKIILYDVGGGFYRDDNELISLSPEKLQQKLNEVKKEYDPEGKLKPDYGLSEDQINNRVGGDLSFVMEFADNDEVKKLISDFYDKVSKDSNMKFEYFISRTGSDIELFEKYSEKQVSQIKVSSFVGKINSIIGRVKNTMNKEAEQCHQK